MTALFWLVFALVAAAWGAAESIFARQVARMCRDKSLNRWVKAGLVAAGKMPAPPGDHRNLYDSSRSTRQI